MYSYDVALASRPSSTTRSIPSMRPSYDAEHSTSATPIYDSLYSEYRRLFRALPGDRTGEENLRFTGFAVREPHRDPHRDPHREPHRDPHHEPPRELHHAPHRDPREAYREFHHGSEPSAPLPLPYPQHQAFHTYAGQAHGTPQYMPAQQNVASYDGNSGHFNSTGQGWVASGYLAPAPTHAGAGQGTGGRHRSMLSLPPGRSGDHV